MFRPHKVASTKLLHVAFEEAGEGSGRPVLLLHGWPDDVRTWDRVVAALVGSGYRTIAPYLRGYGPTHFRSTETMRSGQLAALAADAIEFADALGLGRFSVVGHDWGARAAYILASAFPDRISHCVALSVGHGTSNANQQISLSQAQRFWYHWYMATPRGVAMVREQRRELARYMWETWSPTWKFTAAEFDQTAKSFENPAWADVVVHSYCHRWGNAAGDPRYAELERRLDPVPIIRVPTLVLHGSIDGVTEPSSSEGRERFFAGPYGREVVPGVGHFPQRENGDAVARHILEWLER